MKIYDFKKIKDIKTGTKIKILLLVSLIVLVINYLISLSNHLDFQPIDRDEITETISSLGIVIRNEEILSNEIYTKKNLKYFLSDGERIEKNGIVAEIYESSKDVRSSYKIESLNKELEILEKLNFLKNNISKGVNFVNSQINEQIRNLLLSSHDFNPLKEKIYREKIIYLLNERQIILGKNVNFDKRINHLKEKKEKIVSDISKSIGTINAPNAGIFMGNLDGYEKLTGEKNIFDFDFESLDFKTIDLNSIKNSKNDIGKIITSEEWYIVCKLNEKEIRKINQGDEITIDMQLIDGEYGIPCLVKSIKETKNPSEYIAIFSCNYMNKNIAFLRKENFKF
ncbi:MAG: HlyD family efflux transporter periplasmic adaptor subunit, partial [Clostridia bacterium]|nr:HlyD family efflux transporter periplasmic adaptor subunit [Clostridia bacterium]